MNKIENEILIGERAKYASRNTTFINCTFKDGESPLKESRNIEVFNSNFNWKYPLWYCQDVIVDNTVWNETGRSGVWYTKRINITNSKILAPKQFRRCEDVLLDNVTIPNALETMWSCTNVTIKNNAGCGIYTKQSACNLTILSGTIINNGTGEVNKNNNVGAEYGGGVYNVGTMVLDDDVVIYTGYNKEEISPLITYIGLLGEEMGNKIIIKYGRYIPNKKSQYDEILGVDLASDNQYSEIICGGKDGY